MQGLQGKVAIVTGSDSGIGQAIAIRFAEEGVRVVVNYRRDEAGAQETARRIKEVGGQARVLQADISKQEDVERLMNEALAGFGGLDILVNNAGVHINTEITDDDAMEVYDQVMNVNLRGAYLCAREAVKYFLEDERPGNIINISSVHEIIPNVECMPYGISKGGMGQLTRTLALQYAAKGIRVNGIGPGAIDTEMNAEMMHDREVYDRVIRFVPQGRVGQPSEIASMAAFLASEEAAYITGQTFYVDGGLNLHTAFLHM